MIKKIITVNAVLMLMLSQAYAQHKPAARTQQELQLMRQNPPAPESSVFGKSGGVAMPPNVRYPGEYEESQAVAISWSMEYDNDGNPTTVDTSSIYGYISAQCAKYISDELPVWIRVPIASDTTKVKKFMHDLGWPLTRNYRFYVVQGDDWWMRDFGPNGVYYGSKDSVAFVDMKYYSGRDKDNTFPAYLAQKLGYRNYISKLNGEGGNLMSDGFGKVFYSSMLIDENNTTDTHIPAWGQTQSTDTLKNLLNAAEPINLKTLQCDGGTGHIDLYVKLVDEQTLLVAEYPSSVTAGDRQIIEDNYQALAAMKTTYNRPFRIYRVPMPTNDDGTYASTCAELNFDARTFINGITANKTFIYPSYSDDVDGNQQQTLAITKLYQKLMPGYKIVPIDSRMITTNGGGGAIHCITMQIPAENPVLFWHPSIDGLQPIKPSYHIVSRITNHSGIKTAVCKWRKKNDGAWSTVTLTDSAGYFIGDIQPGPLTSTDWFIYYLTATTNNGKTAVKPITAPDGYYQVYFTGNTDSLTLATEELKVNEKDHLFAAYPNPAQNELLIPFNLVSRASAEIRIIDLTGKLVYSEQLGNVQAGMHTVSVRTSDLSPGMYFYSIVLNGQSLDTRRFIKN